MNSVIQKLKHNTWLKIIALFFAILLWSYVISSTDPTRLRNVKDIAIQANGYEQLEASGLVVRGNFNDVFGKATVGVEARVSEMGQLTNQTVTVTADLTKIKAKGTYDIHLTATTPTGEVARIEPSTIQVEVDELISNTVPVSVEYQGELAPDLYHEEPELSQKTIQITGARTDVERVSKGVCVMDLSKVTESVEQSYTVELRDADGNAITDGTFVGELPSIMVNMEVKSQKTVPIDVSASACFEDAGDIADGKQIQAVYSMPSQVTLVGDKAVLEDVTKVTIKKIRLNGISQTTSFDVALSLPSGVTLITTDKIQLTVELIEGPVQ